MSTEFRLERVLIRFATILLMTLVVVSIGHANSYAATSVPTAKGQVNAKNGVYLRARASTSAKKVVKVKNNAKLTIIKEVFQKKDSNATKYKWYYVKVSGKKGYIQANKVDNIKYSTVTGITTDYLNYRVGPDTKMEKKGTFKIKTLMSVVLPANVKGSATVWYKVKKGNKYYYVCSEWAKLGVVEVAKTVVTPKEYLKPNTPGAERDSGPIFTIKDLRYPETLLEKMSFGLRGTIKCTHTMASAKFGVVDSSGKWVITEEVAVNAEEFNILAVDKNIKFGTLSPGKYTYTGILKVNGKNYTEVSKKFTVKKSTGLQKLAAVAQTLAWPYGTEKSVYGSKPTEAYAAALDQVYPTHNSWGTGPKTGASCDVFIGTVCRFSGVDSKVPRKITDIWEYFEANPDKWVKIPYTYQESELQSGDIILYQYETGGKHICMYININGKGYVAEANYPNKYYGFINSSIKKIFRTTDKSRLEVFRPAD